MIRLLPASLNRVNGCQPSRKTWITASTSAGPPRAETQLPPASVNSASPCSQYNRECRFFVQRFAHFLTFPHNFHRRHRNPVPAHIQGKCSYFAVNPSSFFTLSQKDFYRSATRRIQRGLQRCLQPTPKAILSPWLRLGLPSLSYSFEREITPGTNP